MSESSRGRLAKHLPLLLVTLLLLCVAALLAEAAIRAHLFGADAIRHPLRYMPPAWRGHTCFESGPWGEAMTPDCRMFFKGAELRINSRGRNDHEVDESRPHYRVLVLGDSATMATGVSQQGEFHSLVEARFNRDLESPDFVELYNHGFRGRSTSQELLDFELALSEGPLDAALVAVTPSDLWDNSLSTETCWNAPDDFHFSAAERERYVSSVLGRNKISGGLTKIERATGLWVFNRPRDLFRRLTLRRHSGSGHDDGNQELATKAEKAFRACVQRMRTLADHHEVDLGFILLWYVPTLEIAIMERVLADLHEPTFSLTDVHEAFEDASDIMIFDGDIHPSPAVHAIYGDRIHGWLVDRGWQTTIATAFEARHQESVEEPP